MRRWLPTGIARSIDAASDRERTLLRFGALVLLGAVLYFLVLVPVGRDAERTREALARDRSTLAALQRLEVDNGAVTNAAASASTSADPRNAVLAALDARGLRRAATQVDVRDARVSLVLEAVPFDALVGLIDDLARTARLRALEARILARVDPGTVRAEITFGR